MASKNTFSGAMSELKLITHNRLENNPIYLAL